MKKRNDFELFGTVVSPGKSTIINAPLPSLYSHATTQTPIYVRHAIKQGPVLLITGALHGDEINSIEIVRRMLNSKKSKLTSGTLIAIPIVNIYGFVTLSRYLPDGRDLNRSFPGSASGSLAARLAYFLGNEILPKADYVIDLHTGKEHRTNFPQIRATIDCPKTLKFAKSFNAPIIINSNIRDGSLRGLAQEQNIPSLVYEGGEGLRFDEIAIRYGVRGILNAMSKLKLTTTSSCNKVESIILRNTSWIRAPVSGMLYLKKRLGEKIVKGAVIGHIFDPFTSKNENLISSMNGIIIGKNNLPLVTQGDALLNVAIPGKRSSASIDEIEDQLYDEYNA